MISTYTRVFRRNWQAIKVGKRFLVRQGGTSSSKTFSNLQTLITACKAKKNILCSVVSESMPHMKRGCMRDFRLIMDEEYDDKRMNKTDSIYSFPNGSRIEFFSADDESKCRGPRRDILFLNECNNIPKQAYDQLEVRTRLFCILDFNPVQAFWAHDMQGDENVDFDVSTYQDAKHVLPESIVKSIESRKYKDPNWWNVYGLGQIGMIDGLVIPRFDIIDEFPDIPYRGGIDFGYTNDPTTIIRGAITSDTIYADEQHYQTGMFNSDIARRLKQLEYTPNQLIFADCAEPKSIAEIRRFGFNIKPSIKGKDSIYIGIDYINRYTLKVTKRSTNMIKELRNYQYEKDKEGELTNVPIDLWNHCIDPLRYLVSDKIVPKGRAQAARIAY